MKKKTEVLKGKALADNLDIVLQQQVEAGGLTAKAAAKAILNVRNTAGTLTYVELEVTAERGVPTLLARGHKGLLVLWGITLEFLGVHPSFASLDTVFQRLGVHVDGRTTRKALKQLRAVVELYEKVQRQVNAIKGPHAPLELEVSFDGCDTVSVFATVNQALVATIGVDPAGKEYGLYFGDVTDTFRSLKAALRSLAMHAITARDEMQARADTLSLLVNALDDLNVGKVE